METTIKTAVEIVQELLAIHTTRKEATTKLKALQLSHEVKTRIISAEKYSNEAIGEWMRELSNYGDGVMANADRENEYQQIYTNSLGKMSTMTPQEGEKTFGLLENALKRTYQKMINVHIDLPVSVIDILKRQLATFRD